MAVHLSNEDIAGYIYQPDNKDFNHVGGHIHLCRQCKRTYNEMKSIIKQLGNSHLLDPVQITEPHVCDEDMIAYVKGRLSNERLSEVQAHLDSCGNCMKAVLRYRAFTAEYESNRINDTNVTPISSRRRVRKVNTFVMPAAVAATLLMAVALVFQFKVLQLNPAKGPVDIATTQPKIMLDPTPSRAGIIPVSATNEKGAINWYGGFIDATATGTADMNKMKNRIQAESVAEKTARHLAYAQLAESLEGIQVTGTASYKDLLLASDQLNLQSEGFIRGAKVIDKAITWVDDAPKAVVTVRAPLYGQDSLRNLLEEAVLPMDSSTAKKQYTTMHSSPALKANTYSSYSNVIIDATGADYSPALFPALVTHNNDAVLGQDTETELQIMYFSSLKSARASNFAGQRPLVIKAGTSPKKGVLVLKPDNAQITQSVVRDDLLPNRKPMLIVF